LSPPLEREAVMGNRITAAIAFLLLVAPAACAQPMPPMQKVSADSCATDMKKVRVQTNAAETSCKHHLNGPDRFLKVTG